MDTSKVENENWRAVVGEAPELQSQAPDKGRAYFPCVGIAADYYGDGKVTERSLCINEGGGEMADYDARTVVIAYAPKMLKLLRKIHATDLAAIEELKKAGYSEEGVDFALIQEVAALLTEIDQA